MSYSIKKINHPAQAKASLLLIYTGGTLGMIKEAGKNHLIPFNFEGILEKLPELNYINTQVSVLSFNPLLDSSNITPTDWISMATIIGDHYNLYDGFVIIHGTDTMAYSASMLSFLLENLNKPVIFTGAQLPIGAIRTDARENLITALEIAAAKKNNHPVVSEAGIYFNARLFRGCRARKVESTHFDAFQSDNYPPLAQVGVDIEFHEYALKKYNPSASLTVHTKVDTNVLILKLFPGLEKKAVQQLLQTPDLKGVIMETYGTGNAPTASWFIDLLRDAIKQGLIIGNISQCNGGHVRQDHYETGRQLEAMGILSGGDMTTEAAVTKLMFLLGHYSNTAQVRDAWTKPQCGEMSI